MSDPLAHDEDLLIVAGVEITSSTPGVLHHFRIGGSPNLLPLQVRHNTPKEAPVGIGPEPRIITDLRSMPWLVYPNYMEAEVEVEPGAMITAHSLVYRVEWNSEVGRALGYGEPVDPVTKLGKQLRFATV